jgi:hypothetical protein
MREEGGGRRMEVEARVGEHEEDNDKYEDGGVTHLLT